MGGLNNTSMRVGVFGGTFDPPHLGHLILAAECHYQLNLDRLLWVLTSHPPHKKNQNILPIEQRLELVQAAISENPAFEISRVDIDRPAPHYAVDTVHRLALQFPGAQIIYLLGGDSLHDLPTWYAPKEFLKACSAIGVMRRPGDQIDLSNLERRLPGITQKVRFVDAPLLEISSSEIRHRISNGEPFRYYVPKPVYEIINTLCLYRNHP